MNFTQNIHIGWFILAAIIGISSFVVLLWLLAKVVRWAKRRPAGAYVILAIFPLISLLPIPHSEIKKLQRVKQEQVQQKEQSGEPETEDDKPAV
ncbi:hypothetical protein [Rheinheimera sp. SA_1]|jgi:hypothetical protein|uniref:hypothetical protein n=1 Tax=Rheinheimera sp. SA_1 TaxID=1827365 RepID=UPI000A898ED4|nr:hypothetical protein [Rheinheimera sp. SA_1]